jgi:hypothetical protein
MDERKWRPQFDFLGRIDAKDRSRRRVVLPRRSAQQGNAFARGISISDRSAQVSVGFSQPMNRDRKM